MPEAVTVQDTLGGIPLGAGDDGVMVSRLVVLQVSMALVDEMLEKGIIGQDDYEKWLRHMTQKYNPPVGRVVSKKSS